MKKKTGDGGGGEEDIRGRSRCVVSSVGYGTRVLAELGVLKHSPE